MVIAPFTAGGALPLEGPQAVLKLVVLAFERPQPPRLGLDQIAQRLDRRQRDPVGVDRVVGAIVAAKAKLGAKVLGHRPHVPGRGGIVVVPPGGDRQRADPVQHQPGIDGVDIVLAVAIADAQGRAAGRAARLIRGGREADRQARQRTGRIAAQLTGRAAPGTTARPTRARATGTRGGPAGSRATVRLVGGTAGPARAAIQGIVERVRTASRAAVT